MSQPSIPFIDLKAQQAVLGDRVHTAIGRVLEHGQYIMGPEVTAFEKALAAFTGVPHVISCGSGTDALVMVMMAWGIGPGDAVFVPSFTFVATAECVALVGATPVFVDADAETFNMDVNQLDAAIQDAKARGLTPRAVIPVDMFGRPADHVAITAIAARYDLKVLDDAAQGLGGVIDGKAIGNFGDATATSFFPAKPLGCYGDGGAILTHNDELATLLRSIRIHGKGTDKYDNVRVGLNARMDTIQAAVLLEKLSLFADELAARQKVADSYAAQLADVVAVPQLPASIVSAWAQYTIKCENRDDVQARCKEAGVPTQVYYPMPLHMQTGYAHYPTAPGGCPVSEQLSQSVLSLPMHPFLEADVQGYIIETVKSAV